MSHSARFAIDGAPGAIHLDMDKSIENHPLQACLDWKGRVSIMTTIAVASDPFSEYDRFISAFNFEYNANRDALAW